LKGGGSSNKARNKLALILTGQIRIRLNADHDPHVEAPPIWDVPFLPNRVEYGEAHPEIPRQSGELNDFRNSLRQVDRQGSREAELLLGIGYLPTREPCSLDIGQVAERARGVPTLARPLLAADVTATSPNRQGSPRFTAAHRQCFRRLSLT
jgi:hypothetical protein